MKCNIMGGILVISIVLAGCTTPHTYPKEFDYSYTLSDRNYTFAIYNNKHRLMTHPIRDLQLQMDRRKKDCNNKNPISDIYIVSHGWNYTATEAVANYHKYIELADEVLGNSHQLREGVDSGSCGTYRRFQPFFMFVTWTSTARPLSELSSGVLPLGLDNVVHPIAWTVDSIAFHIPSAWKQSLNAASNALGNVFPDHFLFQDWETQPFGTEPGLSFLKDEDYSLGRNLPLSALVYELIKCKYSLAQDITETSGKCLLEDQNLEGVNIHLVGHSYGGKLVALAGIESLRRWMLVDRLKIKPLGKEATDSEEEEYEDTLRNLGHQRDMFASFGLRTLECIFIAGCADESKAENEIGKEIKRLTEENLPMPITSLVLFNPAFHPGELWYSTRNLWEFEKAPVSLIRLIERKGIVYSKHDTPNGTLFNIRELLLNTQVTQSFQQQVQTDWHHNKWRLAFDIPVGVTSSIVYGSLLYVGTTIYNLPLDFWYHVKKNEACGLSEDTHPLGRPFYWLANTVDFFVPFLCGLHKLNIGPLRDEDKQGLFRLSRPALGKTGINKLAVGRKTNVNLWGLNTFYDEKEIKNNRAENYSVEQFCEFSYPMSPIKIPPFLLISNPPPRIRNSIYSFDASKVYNTFISSHSDLGKTEKVACDKNDMEPQEKRKYSFTFTYKFTKTDFWNDPALEPTPTKEHIDLQTTEP